MPDRPRDVVWDALVEIFGEPTNTNTRGQRNKAVKLLKESGATPESIKERWAAYKRTYSGAAQTPLALANQWDNLAPKVVTGSGNILLEGIGAEGFGDASQFGHWNVVADYYQAQWPNRTFDVQAWESELSEFPSHQIIRALKAASFSSPYPPGISEIKRRCINEDLGDEAPPSPKVALALVRQLVENLGAGLDSTPLPPAVSAAVTEMRKITNGLDEGVFLEMYGAELERIYSNHVRP